MLSPCPPRPGSPGRSPSGERDLESPGDLPAQRAAFARGPWPVRRRLLALATGKRGLARAGPRGLSFRVAEAPVRRQLRGRHGRG